MEIKRYQSASILYKDLIALKGTIEGLEAYKNENVNKILLMAGVKNPVIVTIKDKKIVNEIIDLLLKHKIPLFDLYKKEFQEI